MHQGLTRLQEVSPSDRGAAWRLATLVPSRVGVGSVPAWVAVPLWTLAITVAAQVRIPVPGTDVPMTLQLLAVLLAGFAMSPGRAVAAVLLYLACGASGLPVFAGPGGLFGATGGYLFGFVLAAFLVSLLKGDGNARFGRILSVALLGTGAVFTLGLAWRVGLAGIVGGDVVLALSTGAVPFVVKGAIETLLVASMVSATRALRRGGT